MTSALTPTCPLTNPTQAEPDCAKRLDLNECLEQWRQEAHHGVIDTGRYRCRFVAWGRGPTLVLIPGLASDALSFVMLIARLQSHFCCISYDLPDGNADGAHLMTYRHDDLVSDLVALLDHLHIDECSLLGFSLGSTIAVSALHRQPGRFPRAILQGGFARRALSAAEVFLASWGRFLPGRLGQLPWIERILEKNHRAPFLAREPAVWDFFVERHCQVPLRAFASRALMIDRLDLRPTLPALRQPVLMVCGDRDPQVGKACAQELTQGLPFAARAEIEQCGQQPHLTHPEVLAEVVRQYLLPVACG